MAESSPAAMKVIVVWFLNNFRYYVVLSKAIFFVIGLLFTYRFVEYAVFDILVTHITDDWIDPPTLLQAVTMVNLHQGAYEVLQIFFAYIADAYLGLFHTVISSTILYIIGLVLSVIAASLKERVLHLGIFYPALVLITLSQSAKRVTLKSFLGDQILAKDEKRAQEYDEERAISRGKFWWNLVSLSAAIVAIYGTGTSQIHIESFRVLLTVSAIAMGVGFLWFLLGSRFYTYDEPTGSPLNDVVFVIYAAVVKRNVESPEQLLPRVPWLRWLDRAAIVVQDQGNTGNNNKNFCTVEQVMGVKFLLKMLPLWATFLTFSLVVATGKTFFLEEAKDIDKNFLILFFIVLERFTQFVIAEMSDFVLEKISKKKNNNIVQRLILFRIGIGMFCCVLCCIAAWINESFVGSVFRMVPQFILLGAMKGLSGDGFESFFDSQVSKSISGYGPSFRECVMGMGKFLSAVWILSLRGLFKDHIEGSHLCTYYAILAIMSSTNLVVYWLIAYWYGDGRFPVEDIGAVQEEVQVSKQSQPLLEIKVVTQNQKAMSSCDSNGDGGERTNYDIRSTDHNSSGLANGPADPLLGEVRSFPRTFSRRFNKRFNSMH